MVDVYRRPNSPFWYFDITVDGRRKRRSTKRTTKAEAEAVAATELTKQLNAAQFGELPELTLREALFDHFLPSRKKLASYVELERHCHTLCGDRKGIDGVADGGSTKFHMVKSTDLQKYRNARVGAGMAERSVNLEIRCLSAAYNMVSEDYRVRTGLRFPTVVPPPKARPLTPDEETALLADLDPERKLTNKGTAYLNDPLARIRRQRVDNYDLAVLLLDTGARFGEIAGLTWAMVDTTDFATIRLIRTKVQNASILATTERMAAVLRRRRGDRSNSHYVFPGWAEDGEDGRRESTAALRRALNRIGVNSPANVAVYGRRDVRSLRDTFASKLRRAGVSVDRIQPLLGHSTITMTMKYADLGVDQASREAVGLLNQINGSAA